MQTMKKYDSIIIGSGQAGNPLLFDLAKRGQKVALIEKNELGGSCINFGCSPTKTLLASSNLHHRVQNSGELGVIAENVELDFKKVMNRKNSIVKAFRGTIEKRVNKNDNIDLYKGHASFIDKNTINIQLNSGGEEKIQADKIFIDTGSRPRVIPLEGLEDIDYYNSTSIMELDELPEHLIILGTSYIALEFAQMFKRFGSKVTMVGRGDTILKREDQDISNRLQEILEDDGVKILLNTTTKRVEKSGNEVNLYIERNKKEEKLVCSHLMLAVGRSPSIDELKLENAGVDLQKNGHIKVDDRLKTTTDNIYALGDVKGGAQFTHIAYDDFRIVRDNLFGEAKRNINDRLEPYTLFTEPQLGRVGLTEEQALQKGYNIKTNTVEMSKQGRPIEENYTQGFMKAVINAEDHKILGVSILGYQGGEIMTIVEVAMMAEMTYEDLRDAIFTHPTLSEILNGLFDF